MNQKDLRSQGFCSRSTWAEASTSAQLWEVSLVTPLWVTWGQPAPMQFLTLPKVSNLDEGSGRSESLSCQCQIFHFSVDFRFKSRNFHAKCYLVKCCLSSVKQSKVRRKTFAAHRQRSMGQRQASAGTPALTQQMLSCQELVVWICL